VDIAGGFVCVRGEKAWRFCVLGFYKGWNVGVFEGMRMSLLKKTLGEKIKFIKVKSPIGCCGIFIVAVEATGAAVGAVVGAGGVVVQLGT
jgi:hypothetical protein